MGLPRPRGPLFRLHRNIYRLPLQLSSWLYPLHVITFALVKEHHIRALPSGINFFLYVLWGLFFCYIAGSVGLVFTKDADGSGIPEFRVIMGGVPIYRFLSMRTYIGRIIGLTSSIAAGLSVGKEGPFINLAACLTQALSRVPIFRSVRNVLRFS